MKTNASATNSPLHRKRQKNDALRPPSIRHPPRQNQSHTPRKPQVEMIKFGQNIFREQGEWQPSMTPVNTSSPQHQRPSHPTTRRPNQASRRQLPRCLQTPQYKGSRPPCNVTWLDMKMHVDYVFTVACDQVRADTGWLHGKPVPIIQGRAGWLIHHTDHLRAAEWLHSNSWWTDHGGDGTSADATILSARQLQDVLDPPIKIQTGAQPSKLHGKPECP